MLAGAKSDQPVVFAHSVRGCIVVAVSGPRVRRIAGLYIRFNQPTNRMSDQPELPGAQAQTAHDTPDVLEQPAGSTAAAHHADAAAAMLVQQAPGGGAPPGGTFTSNTYSKKTLGEKRC